MILPIWAYVAGGALLVGGIGGWTVRDWKCDAAVAKALKAGIAKGKKQQAAISTAATTYEEEKADAVIHTNTLERETQVIYRNIKVPAVCEPPAAAISVLERALDSANARARGEPGGGLPATPTDP